jgi:hypothetical protein
LALVFVASLVLAIVGCKKEETPPSKAKPRPTTPPAAVPKEQSATKPAVTPPVKPTVTPPVTPTTRAATSAPGK